MLPTISRFGITLLVASTWSVASSANHLVLARAIASDHPHNHLSTVTAQVPTDSAPTRPQNSPNSRQMDGLRCISGCVPQYPAALAGEEGRVRVRLVIDRNGNVIDAQVLGGNASTEYSVEPNGNAVPKDGETSIHSRLAEAALTAARQMKFTPLANKEQAVVTVNINYTNAGFKFDRQFRQRQERERQEQERQERKRQEQLERERQEQLERERQQQQETEPIPATE
ncbi:MAG: TonB family protein [Cyanobacteriota bacterium]